MVPVYFAEMYDLKEEESEVWQFLTQGNFSITKIDVPFCAIGADHRIEHKNRAIKVIGRIRDLLSNTEASERFFLVVPDINPGETELKNRYGNDVRANRITTISF